MSILAFLQICLSNNITEYYSQQWSEPCEINTRPGPRNRRSSQPSCMRPEAKHGYWTQMPQQPQTQNLTHDAKDSPCCLPPPMWHALGLWSAQLACPVNGPGQLPLLWSLDLHTVVAVSSSNSMAEACHFGTGTAQRMHRVLSVWLPQDLCLSPPCLTRWPHAWYQSDHQSPNTSLELAGSMDFD